MNSYTKVLAVAVLALVPLSSMQAQGLVVPTTDILVLHPDIEVPLGMAPHVYAIPNGSLKGVLDDGRLIGSNLTGNIGVGGSVEWEAGSGYTLTPMAIDWGLLWAYSIEHHNGQPVLTLRVAWNEMFLKGEASAFLAYTDLGITAVELGNALLDGHITQEVYDAILNSTEIRFPGGGMKTHALQSLVQLQYSRYVMSFLAQYMSSYYRYWSGGLGQAVTETYGGHYANSVATVILGVIRFVGWGP